MAYALLAYGSRRDGFRDLVIGATGGIGRFTHFAAMRRDGEIFKGDGSKTWFAFQEFGRASSATLVKLQGGVYALNTVSSFGVDDAYLQRPFFARKLVPRLRINYTYALEAKTEQRGDQRVPSPAVIREAWPGHCAAFWSCGRRRRAEIR